MRTGPDAEPAMGPGRDPRQKAAERLLEAWRGEIEARRVYELIARRERDPRRARILRELADAEGGHRRRLEGRMRELGVPVPDERSVRVSPWLRMQARVAPLGRLLAAREAAETDEVGGVYGQPTGDAATDAILREIRSEEGAHSVTVRQMLADRAGTAPAAPAGDGASAGRLAAPGAAGGPPGPERSSQAPDGADARSPSAPDAGTASAPARQDAPAPGESWAPRARLDRILGRERWHSGSGGWISGAIYGANDGLAAVFGIVAGVSGATGGNDFVLTAGLAGAIASALSMATGAFLAERSEMEVATANLQQERREIVEHPEEEREELSLYYQLKGIDRKSADELAAKLAEQPEAMLSVLAAEELGTTQGAGGKPVQAALAGGLSTAAGAIVPVIPFFFATGTPAIIAAAAVSLVAHFLVGAAKSLVTLRSWWAAGLEMTVAGVIVGGALYGVGLALPVGTTG
jgi:VIT1/CCC1 family predicted Fe2+/Mn2+ transporter